MSSVRTSAGPHDPEPARAAAASVTASRPLARGGLLEAARAALATGPGLLLDGPAGIGKTTLLGALVREVEEDRTTVLSCTPVREERSLPFTGLIDLLSPVSDRRLASLPPEARDALRGALLRGGPAETDRGRIALRVAVAELLRGLALEAPLLLVLDGIQWLDRPTAQVLSYVAHRAGELGLRIVAVERAGGVPALEEETGEEPMGQSLDSGPGSAPGSGSALPGPVRPRVWPRGSVELTVPPLSLPAVEQLLFQDAVPGAPALSPRLLRQIHQASGGNPQYALELGRCSGDGLSTVLRVPHRLRVGLTARMAVLPPRARTALLLAATAGRPDLSLLRAAGVADPVAVLAEPERLGLVETRPGGEVDFRHPLLRAAVVAEATTGERLSAHADLAAVLTEPVEHARHLGLARPYQDAAVASTLAEAAAGARRGGFPDAAYELAALAVERTPTGMHGDRVERALAAAGHAVDAGLNDEARRAAESVLALPARAAVPDTGQRVRARLVLLETAGQALGGAGGLIEAGLADADGHPGLEARLRLWAAVRDLLGGNTATAALQARRAAELAARVTDRATSTSALGLLATVQAMRGAPQDAERTLGRALRLALSSSPSADHSLVRRQALADLDADRVPEAQRRISGLLLAQEQAGVEDSLATLLALVRVQVRGADCALAPATAERCTRLLADADVTSPLGAYAAALAEAVAGTAERATALAQAAVDGSAADGDRLFLIRALGVLGAAQLLTGHTAGAAAAADSLQQARRLGTEMELGDPDTVRRLADLVEASVLLGETAEAVRVLAEARQLAAGWVRPWGGSAIAGLDRAEALIQATLGNTEAAAAALAASAERLRVLPVPLELGRTLIAWGAVERRARHRTVARRALVEAAEVCRDLGAMPLLRRAEAELDRLTPGERVGAAVELTASEQRVAELVAGGATNREVAALLFLSVKTVEGTLSRVYRKLGVRSRTALARAAGVPRHDPFTDEARVTPLMRELRTS